MTPLTIRPFSTGSQYEAWSEANCGACARSDHPEPLREPPCPLELALLEACFGDGEVSDDVAERTGTLDARPPRREGFLYCWRCKEFVPRDAG